MASRRSAAARTWPSSRSARCRPPPWPPPSCCASAGSGVSVAVVSSLNPSPSDELCELLGRVRLAISIESHYLNGGLGSFVAETIAENALGVRLIRRGITEMPRGLTGSPAFLYEQAGLSSGAIADSALAALGIAANS